ncbi:MAG: hypothetical protein SFU98_07450 [Leptospiraceae bacterium]|nr:hypothetical protein [Leptospiraceae bacterium]
MRNQLLLFLIVLTLVTACGPKKKVTKFEVPKQILFLDQTKLEAYKSTEKKQKPDLELSSTESEMKVISKTEIQKKDSTDVWYEVSCPESKKSICSSDSIFVEGNKLLNDEIISLELTNSKNQQIILDSGDIENAKKTKEWFNSPSKIAEVSISEKILLLLLSKISNKDELLGKLEELSIVFKLNQGTEYKDTIRIDPIIKKYASINKRNKENPTPLITILPTTVEKLEIEKINLIEKVITGFPMREQSFKGLVNQFNKLKKIPYLQEKILEKVIEKTEGVNKKLEFTPLSEVKLIETNDGASNEQLIESITASTSGDDFDFQIKTSNGEITIAGMQNSPYLLTGGPGFKEYVKNLPVGRYKELIANDYWSGVLQTALKEGKGGFNESTGLMEYRFNANDGYKYWVILEIFRMHPSVKRDTEFSGSFSCSLGDGICKWRQPKGELYISFTESYGGDASPTTNEFLCMTEKGSEGLDLKISPADLRSKEPKIIFDLQCSGAYGSDFVNALLNSK